MMETIMHVGLAIVTAHLVLGLMLWLRVWKLYSYPGHFGFPILGNLYCFYKTLFIGSMDGMFKYMVEISDKYGRHGLGFHWLHGYRVSVAISSPQLVKELAFHPNLNDKPNVMYGALETYFNGPFTTCSSNTLWKVKRKEYNIFLKRSYVENNYYNSFIKCANKIVKSMMDSPSAVDAHHKTIAVSQNVTTETLFGLETIILQHPKVIHFMSKLSDIGTLFFGNPILIKIISALVRPVDGLFLKKAGRLRKLMVDYASAKNQCSLAEQTLSMQIMSRIIKYKQSKKILENEMHELFLTASHTVTAALSSALIFLALLPDIQEKAWQEQFEIFGFDDREPTLDDLKQMQFLDRFIKEALRFSAPPFVGKLVSADIKINGVTIPKGSSVMFLMRHIRMDSKLWENPNLFNPDRFLEESDLLKHTYTPFGIGIRNCPGTHYATLMMKVTLSKVLRRLILRPVDDKIGFEDIRYKYQLMSEVANPPMLRVEERT